MKRHTKGRRPRWSGRCSSPYMAILVIVFAAMVTREARSEEKLAIADKTLVAWVAPVNLDPARGERAHDREDGRRRSTASSSARSLRPGGWRAATASAVLSRRRRNHR